MSHDTASAMCGVWAITAQVTLAAKPLCISYLHKLCRSKWL